MNDRPIKYHEEHERPLRLERVKEDKPLMLGGDLDNTLKSVENYSVEDLHKVDLAEAREHRKTTMALAIASTVFAGISLLVVFRSSK